MAFADARSLLQDAEGVNLIATIVGASVTFSGSDYGAQTVTLTGTEPIVTYQVTAGEPHGGKTTFTCVKSASPFLHCHHSLITQDHGIIC